MVNEDGRTSAVSLHPTTQSEPSAVLFRSLVERRDFYALDDLCRERMLLARDDATALRWHKDLAIVKALQGRYGEALNVLSGAQLYASRVTGPLRGRYENEFGLVLVEFGRPLLALDRFDLAIECQREDPKARGEVWNNRAVARAVMGDEAGALRDLASAVELLKASDDYAALEEARATAQRIIGKVGY